LIKHLLFVRSLLTGPKGHDEGCDRIDIRSGLIVIQKRKTVTYPCSEGTFEGKKWSEGDPKAREAGVIHI
jgi:hypothetical protein